MGQGGHRLMEVLLLTNAVTPDKLGGSYRYARELADELATRGVDVTVLTKRLDRDHPPVERTAAGALISRFEVPSKARRSYAASYPLAVASAVLLALRQHPNALVHAHYPVPALPVALARRPFLYTFQAPVHRELLSERQGTYALPAIANRPAVAAVRAAERLIAKRASRVVVLSEFTRGELALLDRRASQEATLIPGGIDLERFRPAVRATHAWPALFTARRLTPRTGIRELIAAMPSIVAEFPDATLAIAGSGESQASLNDQIDALGLAASTTLLGRIPEDQLVGRYQQADLVVLPTQELEGFGLTTAEALACGTPVLGTPAGATPEILRPVDSALLSGGSDPGQIAQAAIALLSDRARLERLRAVSRARVTPAFGWGAVAPRYIELYREIAKLTSATN
jgi:glycosyltransferase involved in cell wall biosynthesis